MPTSKDHAVTKTLDTAPGSSNEHWHCIPDELHANYDSINILPGLIPDDPPLYLENDTSLRDRIPQLSKLAQSNAEALPILSYPYPNLPTWGHPTNLDPVILARQDIVKSYFNAIKTKKDELVAAFIESGAVTPETTNIDGRTPLLAAIEAGNVRMVQELMDFGADVNAFGIVSNLSPVLNHCHGADFPPIFRSPLMCAAEHGNLTIVKLLMETYGADDALVAPDGELALRLAASNGHRDVVKYLPTRRRGGWKRWKTKHRKAMRRCARAAKGIYGFFYVLGFELPKFFLWTVPKHCIVLPICKSLKWLKEHYTELPERIAAWMKDIWKGIKAIPKGVWKFTKELVDFIWTGIKRLPKALKVALLWAYTGLKKAGGAIWNVFTRFLSFIHTTLAAVANFFQTITLKDVWDGFKAFLHALFVAGPKSIWTWICTFQKMTLKMMKALWGCTGRVLWMLLWGFVALFLYVPKKLVEILVSAGGSVGGAFKEVLIWIDPKRR